VLYVIFVIVPVYIVNRAATSTQILASNFVVLLEYSRAFISNGPLYSNTVIGTLSVDGWAVTFGTARRDLGVPTSYSYIRCGTIVNRELA